jgi:hypothetical protein
LLTTDAAVPIRAATSVWLAEGLPFEGESVGYVATALSFGHKVGELRVPIVAGFKSLPFLLADAKSSEGTRLIAVRTNPGPIVPNTDPPEKQPLPPSLRPDSDFK